MSDPNVPEYEFDLETVASALFAAQGIESGLWRLGVKLHFAALSATWPDSTGGTLPTGMVGVDGLAFFKVDKPGPLVFDAGELIAKRRALDAAIAARRQVRARIVEQRAKRRANVKP